MFKNTNIRFSIVVLAVLAIFCGMGYYYRTQLEKKIQFYANSQNSAAEIALKSLSDSKKSLVLNPLRSPGHGVAQALQNIQENPGTESGLKLPTLFKDKIDVYSESERNRRNGYMWVDSITDKYIVTLGNINGVFPGGYLTVYDNENPIGQVRVLTAYEVISYVEPFEPKKFEITKDYYQVFVE